MAFNQRTFWGPDPSIWGPDLSHWLNLGKLRRLEQTRASAVALVSNYQILDPVSYVQGFQLVRRKVPDAPQRFPKVLRMFSACPECPRRFAEGPQGSEASLKVPRISPKVPRRIPKVPDSSLKATEGPRSFRQVSKPP